jgi:NAD(P)-dependent dehydrogenase (short-subunit alcohol dehydrogenase family)
MKEQEPQGEYNERGAIVLISSVAGCQGRTEEIAYAPSKGAVNGMVLPWARDLSKYGIRVNCISPGPFDTAMAWQISEAAMEGLRKAIPVGRVGSPPEFAHAAQFLVENTYMTGSILYLDGGLRVPFV